MMTSCRIENLEVDIIGPSLAIDGTEVMGAGAHHCHTVHLYFKKYMIPSFLALHGKQVPMRDRDRWCSAAESIAPPAYSACRDSMPPRVQELAATSMQTEARHVEVWKEGSSILTRFAVLPTLDGCCSMPKHPKSIAQSLLTDQRSRPASALLT